MKKEARSGGGKLLKVSVGLVLAIVGCFVGYQLFLTPSPSNAAEYTLRAEEAIDRGNWGGLEAIAREWASEEPSNPLPWDYAAQAAMQLGSPKLAADYLREALPTGGVDVFQKLGFIQMEFLNDPLGTKQTCDATLKRFPKDSQTHERLLFYYTMTCQRNQIAEEAWRAIDEGCDTLATYSYLVAAKWITFTNGFETNIKWLENAPGEELFEVASVLHLPSYPMLDELAKQVAEPGTEPKPLEFASMRVSDLRKKYPGNLQLLAIETRDLCRAGDLKAVGERLASLEQNALLDNRFWRFKGWFHAARNETNQAQKAYENALKINPFDWATRVELAALLRSTAGVEVSKPVQQLADEGKKLMFAIQDNANLHRLEPEAIYEDLEAYFRNCDQEQLANGLVQRLQEAGIR